MENRLARKTLRHDGVYPAAHLGCVGHAGTDFQRQLSAKTRAASAYNKITNAIRQLEGENKEITKTAVFRITKQDKRTITKFFNSCLSSIQAVKSLNAAMLNIAQQQKLERSNKHVCSIT